MALAEYESGRISGGLTGMEFYYGVDMGGTTIKMGRFDREGTLLEKWEIPTRKEDGGKHIFDDIAEAILTRTAAAGGSVDSIKAVGIDIPGTIWEDGYLELSVNVGLKDIYPTEELSRRLNHVPVACGNDASIAALGEYWKGGGAGHRSMVLITLGTGVGGGIVLDGKVIAGAHGIGGEIGHLPVRFGEQEVCNCGNRGCLEQVSSATGIVRETKRTLVSSDQPSSLREIRNLTAKDVLDAAKAGDALAKSVMDTVTHYLGVAMGIVSNIVDPEVFVIGGGVSAAGQDLIEWIREAYDANMYMTKKRADVQLAQLGNDAGIYGSVRLVLPE